MWKISHRQYNRQLNFGVNWEVERKINRPKLHLQITLIQPQSAMRFSCANSLRVRPVWFGCRHKADSAISSLIRMGQQRRGGFPTSTHTYSYSHIVGAGNLQCICMCVCVGVSLSKVQPRQGKRKSISIGLSAEAEEEINWNSIINFSICGQFNGPCAIVNMPLNYQVVS